MNKDPRIKELEQALKDDATDLWKVTNAIKKEIASREWIMEGRGCYAWDDNRYKDETRLAFEAIMELIKNVQHPAQLRFQQVIDNKMTSTININFNKRAGILHTHIWDNEIPNRLYSHSHSRGDIPHGHHGSRYWKVENKVDVNRNSI